MAKTQDAGGYQRFQTKKRVADGLLKLMEQYPFRDITVTQICQEAEIARVTFYRLFDTKESVIRFYIHGLLSDFSGKFHSEKAGIETIRFLFDHFPIPVPVLTMLAKQNLYPILYAEFQNVIGHFFQINEGRSPDPGENSYRINFIASTLLIIFITWVQNGCRESEQELVRIAARQLQIPACNEA